MDRGAFLEYLKGRGVDAESAERQLCIADHLDTMMSSRRSDSGSGCGTSAARSLIECLKESKQDTYENIAAILRYGRFAGNDEVYVEALKVLDGLEAMDNLYLRLAEIAGEAERDRIFGLIGEITPGTSFEEKAAAMRTVMREIVGKLSGEQKDLLFKRSFRDLYGGDGLEERKLFEESGGVDGYIEAKRRKFIAALEASMDEGKLFFGQEITPEVVELVRSDPEMAFGTREGGSVFVTKIPFRAKKWLEEKDPAMRRYLYCHCPWARESLLSEEGAVPSEFCRCSAGFHKKDWEDVAGEEVGCDVLESVLAGNDRCRFRIKLPSKLLEGRA